MPHLHHAAAALGEARAVVEHMSTSAQLAGSTRTRVVETLTSTVELGVMIDRASLGVQANIGLAHSAAQSLRTIGYSTN